MAIYGHKWFLSGSWAWSKLDGEDFRLVLSGRLVFMGLIVKELGFSTLLWIARDGISPLETNRKTLNPMYKWPCLWWTLHWINSRFSMKRFPLFPLIKKLERKFTNVLCLKVDECMGVCLDNLLVCNKPCDTIKMSSKLQLVFNKILDLLGVSQTLLMILIITLVIF